MREERGTSGSSTSRKIARLRGLIRKEFIQIVRDPSSIAIAFVMPLVLLVVFGYGVSLDAEHVPIVFVIEDQTPEAWGFYGAFQNPKYFRPFLAQTMEDAERAMVAGRADGIVRVRSDFADSLRRGESAPVQVIVNGVDANNARIVQGYVEGAYGAWLGEWARQNGVQIEPPVVLEHRIWFNAEVRSRYFLVPGLIAVIMTLSGALLTAMVMAREYERGTMENLMVTPVTMNEIIVGKLVPYFTLGMAGMALSVAVGVWVFGVPLRGSAWLLVASAALFMLVALGMGLLISIIAKDQFLAGQMAIITTYLPAFLLSGFIFDIRSMPIAIQVLTHVVGARYFVAILQTLFLAGDVYTVIIPNAAALILMATFFLGMSRLKSRKRLD